VQQDCDDSRGDNDSLEEEYHERNNFGDSGVCGVCVSSAVLLSSKNNQIKIYLKNVLIMHLFLTVIVR